MRRLWLVPIVATTMVLHNVAAQPAVFDLRLLAPAPGELRNITGSDSGTVFRGEELYRHVDGGADLFLEYGFRQVLVRDYGSAGVIRLEIYEMEDSASAFGVYSLRSGGEAIPMEVGKEGSVSPYYIMFWKGRFYVSVAGVDTTSESEIALESIARAVDKKITGRAQRPSIVGLLPLRGLKKPTYCRGILGLSSIYVFDTKEVFHGEECAVGLYPDHTLFVFGYRDSSASSADFTALRMQLPINPRFKEHRIEDRALILTDRADRVLWIALAGRHVIVSIAENAGRAEAVCRALRAVL